MIYKSLAILFFANMFNQAYQIQTITCPKWVPGTNQILPAGVTLSPELELKNRVRCYCQVVMPQERGCIANNIPKNLCKARTAAWVEDNLMLKNTFMRTQSPAAIPQRDRMMNVEP